MRKVLLGIVALLVAGELLAATLSRRAGRKVRVSDPALARELITTGATLIADYGAFRLLEADPARVAPLIQAGRAEARDEEDLVLLNTRALDTRSDEAQARTAARAPVETFAGRRLHLVQFAGPVKPEWYAALVGTGAEVVTYIPHNTYLVYGDEESLGRVRALGQFVQWEGPYTSDDRIHPLARPAGGAGRTSVGGGDLYAVQLVADPATNEATSKVLDTIRLGNVRSRFRVLQYENVIVRLDPAQIATLAERPDVVSIQPYVVPLMRDEKQGQIVAGALSGGSPTGPGYLSFLASKGFTQAQFTASGFAVDVSDSGIDDGTTAPNHFGLYANGILGGVSRVIYNRLEGFPLGGGVIQGCDGHGTINAHIIAGFSDLTGFPFEDADGYKYGLGIAPFVRVGSSVIFDPSYTFPNFPDLQSRAYRDGARISSNSWGAAVSGAYNVDSQAYDALVRDAQPSGSAVPVAGNQQMVIVFAAGNDGPVAGSLGAPGTAKNIITAGASENVRAIGGADQCGLDDLGADAAGDIASFSSRGPTTDGRRKPDLVAPGTHVTGGVFQTDTPGPTGQADACFDGTGVCGGPVTSFFPDGQQFYTASSGTSHSTPAIAGGAALVRQYFLNHGLGAPSPAMTKAFLMGSARYLTGAGAGDTLPSNAQGMGLMDLGTAFDGADRVLRDQVAVDMFTATGQTRTFAGTVVDTGRPYRVTLAWTDAPGSTTGNAFRNDLDLTVRVGGVTYRGNVFAGGLSVAGGAADVRNNVESVFLPAGTAGTFTVTVTAANINSDGVPGVGGALDQDFALVVYNGMETPVPNVVAAGSSLASENCGGGNGAIDPGETATVNLSLSNTGTGDTTNLVATLLSSGGVIAPSGPQSYGVLVHAGPAVSRPFTLTAAGTCGGSLVATLQLQDGATDLGTASFTFTLGATAPGGSGAFSNPALITIPSSGSGAPYPSSINVSGLTGSVLKVTATLTGYSHGFSDDVDVLLVGPAGQKVMLMSDAGGGGAPSNITLTFDDAAATAIPDGAPIVSGTFRPANYEGTASDVFAAPAPAGPYATVLAAFNGTNPNGTWSLFVRDDFTGFSGSISGGWRLNIQTAVPACCVGAAGITVTPTSGLTTTEGGGTANFTVALNSAPTADVTIGLSSSDSTEGSVSPASLVFTPANALTPQTVTVTGVDDAVIDGDQAYTIVTAPAVSGDPAYSGLNPLDVSVTNTDDDVISVPVIATAGGTLTAEDCGVGNGAIDPDETVTVSLALQNTGTAPTTSLVATLLPTGGVTAPGGPHAYGVLTPGAPAVARPFALTAAGTCGGTLTATLQLQDGATDLGTVSFAFPLGTMGPGGTTSFASPSAVTIPPSGNASPYPASITASGLTGTVMKVTATLSGFAHTFPDDVDVLLVGPGGQKTLLLSDAGGGGAVTGLTLTFDDAAASSLPNGSSLTSGTWKPSAYEPDTDEFTSPAPPGAYVADLSVFNGTNPNGTWSLYVRDDFSPSEGSIAGGWSLAITTSTPVCCTASPAGVTVTPTSGLVTSEAGGTATFTVVLTSVPTSDVTIGLSSSDLTEGTVSPASLTFTPADALTPKTVTVTGVDDLVADGSVGYTIVTAPAASSDSGYSGRDAADVSVTNTDDDVAGIVVTPTSGLVTTEAGGTATFTVVLTSVPTSDVTIGLSSSDLTEGTVSPASLTFTAADALTPKTVTVTGVDDLVADGSVGYTIVTAPAVSSDSGYSGRDAADVSVTNTDDDVAGIVVTPTSGLVTTEAGGTATFTVVLTSVPTADVTIGLSSSDLTEGAVSPASLTFAPADALIPKTVTVTGADDVLSDGNVAYTILTAPAVSADPLYTGADASDVSVTNNDDELADLIFKDGFESGDVLQWSSSRNVGGRLAATAAAALDGSFGLSANVTDTNALYIQDDTPAAEPRYRARFLFDPNGFLPGPGNGNSMVNLFAAFQGTSTRAITIVLRRRQGQYSVQAQAILDGGTQVSTAFVNITDAPHAVEFDWQRASAAGANNGSLQLWVDGAAVATVGGLDNDTTGVDLARLGPQNLQSGASGTLFFDRFESRRTTPIGP
jgi:subtilisin-like proprotein convertase family protein